MSYRGKIKFFFSFKSRLSDRTRLKIFIEKIFRKEDTVLRELNYVFCSDRELLKINRDFLNHNYYTDILTFNLSPGEKSIQAEIYISIERVRDNAKNLNQSFKRELHRVIFHGVLHLCGYSDKTAMAEQSMRKKEDFYLNQYFA